MTFLFEQECWSSVKNMLQNIQQIPKIKEDTEKQSILFNQLKDIYHYNAKRAEFSVEILDKCSKEMNSDQFNFVDTMVYIAWLALELQNIIKPENVSIIQQSQPLKHTLNRLQIAAVLSHSFLCLHPEKHRGPALPHINFIGMFSVKKKVVVEKTKCLLNYFYCLSKEKKELLEKQEVVFERVVLQKCIDSKQMASSHMALCDFEVDENNLIEDSGSDYTKVDFANMYLGGGILNTGCLQEEIMFAVCPELICGLLFMESMTDNEAIIVHGFKKYSNYSGYGWQLQYEGKCNEVSKEKNFLVAIDALDFRYGGGSNQYDCKNLLREINKAYAGFITFGNFHHRNENDLQMTKQNSNNKPQFSLFNNGNNSDQENEKEQNSIFPGKKKSEITLLLSEFLPCPVICTNIRKIDSPSVDRTSVIDSSPYPSNLATGNWGCGAFLGDPQLKSMLQWIAASEAGCSKIRYYTTKHKDLKHLAKVINKLKAQNGSVSLLWNLLTSGVKSSVFDTILNV